MEGELSNEGCCNANTGNIATGETGIETYTGSTGAFAGANAWITHSCGEEDFGLSLHPPEGMQQVLPLIPGNMKYCAQERQPPHSVVDVRTMARMQLPILLESPITAAPFPTKWQFLCALLSAGTEHAAGQKGILFVFKPKDIHPDKRVCAISRSFHPLRLKSGRSHTIDRA